LFLHKGRATSMLRLLFFKRSVKYRGPLQKRFKGALFRL
jgi:hypothetical protein